MSWSFKPVIDSQEVKHSAQNAHGTHPAREDSDLAAVTAAGTGARLTTAKAGSAAEAEAISSTGAGSQRAREDSIAAGGLTAAAQAYA